MDVIKRLLGYSLILLISLFATASITYAQSGNHGVTLVYTGNLDGELEPCGCSEGGNKGGIKRQVKKIDELRAKEPNLILVSSGGLLISEMPQDKLKSEYILKGLKDTNYDAIGIQWKDLAFGKEFLKKHDLPFVLSNSNHSDFPHLQIIKKKNNTLAFFSWLDKSSSPMASMQDNLANTNIDKLKAELANAKKQKQLTVLSTTYTLKQAQKKLPLDDVDILIIRAKYELYGEPQKTGKTLILQPGSRGMRLGKLSLQINNLSNMWRTKKMNALHRQNHTSLVNPNLFQQLKRKTLDEEMKLISVCQEIGGIAERNNQYTLSLTLHIKKPIESLTVQQLLSFHRECVQRFNQGVNHG